MIWMFTGDQLQKALDKYAAEAGLDDDFKAEVVAFLDAADKLKAEVVAFLDAADKLKARRSEGSEYAATRGSK